MTKEQYYAMDSARNMQQAGSLGCASKPPRPVSGMDMQLNRLDSVSEALHQALNELENRMAHVVMPEPPSPARTTSEPSHSPVGMTNRVATLNDRIEGAHRRIVSLLERIDL